MSKEKQNELLINDVESNSSEDMRNKQIEEMAKVLCENCAGNESPCRVAKSGKMCGVVQREAEALYNAGYRKQSEGEWIERIEPIEWCEDDVDIFYECSCCGTTSFGESPFCPNCGAKMKGESK